MVRDSYNWKRVRSESKPNVFIENLYAVDVISGMHDDKLKDVDTLKSKAMEALVRKEFADGHVADYVYVYLAALSDPAFPGQGKAYALLAASTVKSPEVVSVLKALIPNKKLDYARKLLPGAFYRQGDKSSLSLLTKDADKEVAFNAKFFKEVLSCEKISGNCPHMDNHGVCLHGLMADNCPIVMWGYKVPATVHMHKDQHLPCPRYQSSSPLH